MMTVTTNRKNDDMTAKQRQNIEKIIKASYAMTDSIPEKKRINKLDPSDFDWSANKEPEPMPRKRVEKLKWF